MSQSIEPYTVANILIPYSDQTINYDFWFALGALLFSVITLVYVIRQTKIAKQGLDATNKNIKQADVNRQLELLPKHPWIIQVSVRLEHWIKDIQYNNSVLLSCIENNDATILDKLRSNIIQPNQLSLRGYEKEMPSWLLELYLSGAQYYFAGAGKIGLAVKHNSLRTIDNVQYYLDACKEDLDALMELKKILDGMIPRVILETPASLSSNEFFVD